MEKLRLGSDKVIEEIKLGLELWDNRYPLEPPSDKHAEILYDTVKRRAKKFENNAVESVRYLLSIIEQAERALQSIVDYPNTEMKSPEDLGYTYQKMAEEALQAIRGNVATEKRGGLLNPDGGDYPLKWMSQNRED